MRIGTRETKDGHRLQYQYKFRFPSVQSPQQDSLIGQVNVEANLRALLRGDLTFEGEKTTHATHRLHAFAAKFPPQLPRLFIEGLTCSGEIVLDPMAGSGTTLVEAILAGRKAVGIDLDPLATFITQVKSKPIDLARCAQLGGIVAQKAKRNADVATEDAIGRVYSPSTIDFFNFWFERHTIAELHALAREIQKIKGHDIRALLQVVFSSTIVTKTGGLTRARDLAHSRPHRDPNKQVKQHAFEVFKDRLRIAIDSLEDIVDANGQAIVIRADARALPLADNSISLIVTSPPYAANAIDYVRAHKFSLMWFGYAPNILSDLRGKYIGSELREPNLIFLSETANRVLRKLKQRDERKAAVVAHYFRDMEVALREMLRVLEKGRAAILVVGSSTIRGIEIQSPTALAEIATSVGFRLIGVAQRRIVRNARMMPVSHNSARNGIEARMHEEGVIGLVKSSS